MFKLTGEDLVELKEWEELTHEMFNMPAGFTKRERLDQISRKWAPLRTMGMLIDDLQLARKLLGPKEPPQPPPFTPETVVLNSLPDATHRIVLCSKCGMRYKAPRLQGSVPYKTERCDTPT